MFPFGRKKIKKQDGGAPKVSPVKQVQDSFRSLRAYVLSLPGEFSSIREKMKDLAKTNTDLGLFHIRAGNFNDAVFRFKMALRFNPDYAPAFYGFGLCRHYEGYGTEAEQHFRKALALNPNYADAGYMLSYYDKQYMPAYIPSGRIREQFNTEAPAYNETHVGQWDYRGYEVVTAVVEGITGGDQSRQLAILDIGCGTGLCGKILQEKRLADVLIGVDLSPAMLAEARNLVINYKPAYNELVEQDYRKYLAETNKKFDAVLAANSLGYMRDISPVLVACKNVLNPQGSLIFLVEKSEEKEVEFLLEGNHFRYSREYIEKALNKAGLQTESLEESLIYKGVSGYIVHARVP